EIAEPLSGSFLVSALRGGTTLAAATPTGLDSLAKGWHRIPLHGDADAVRIAWNGHSGAKAKGRIGELDIASSPLSPSKVVPNLAITYPLHGECQGGQSYVRGFVAPAVNSSGAATVLVDGHALSAPLSTDGSFATVVPRPAGAEAATWSFEVAALYPDGT